MIDFNNLPIKDKEGIMSRLLGNKVGEEVCKVLGLNSSNIAKVDILLHASDAARVEITRFIESAELEGIKSVLEKYEITRMKDEKS